MNSSVYIFGNMQNGYTQYPDDETTHEIFQNFALNAKAPTQLAVHRDGSLMYYGYIRKLEGEQYIGLCVLLNNVMLTNVSSLFALYESTIEMLAKKGCLIKFDTRGNLVANAQHLYMSKTEVESVAAWLQEKVEEYEDATTSIPPVDYAVASTAVKVFSHQDDVQSIITSTHTNGYTYILKAEDYNTVNLDSYQGVLASVTKENEELQRKIRRLEQVNQQQAMALSQPRYVPTNTPPVNNPENNEGCLEMISGLFDYIWGFISEVFGCLIKIVICLFILFIVMKACGL